MTEQEIRQKVKKDFRKARIENFKYWLSDIWLGVLVSVGILILATPFFIHLFGVGGTINMSQKWIITTGILAIPCAVLMTATAILLVVGLPVFYIVEKTKEHNKNVEEAVKFYIAREKQKEKTK